MIIGLIVLFAVDVFVLVKTILQPFDLLNIVAVMSLSVSILTLGSKFYMDVKKQDHDFTIKLYDNKSTTLSKYRSLWLSNLKEKTSIFESNISPLMNISDYKFSTDFKYAEHAYNSINTFSSSLKNEVNPLQPIEKDISKLFENATELLFKITNIPINTIENFYQKAMDAKNLKFLSCDIYNIVEDYYNKISKIQREIIETKYYDSRLSENLKRQKEEIYLQYKTDLPHISDINEDLFSYYIKEFKKVISEAMGKLRVYYKTEWDRIYFEITNIDESKTFDFDSHYNINLEKFNNN